MRRRFLPGFVMIGLVAACVALWWRPWRWSGPGGPGLPGRFAGDLPADCRQVVLVLSPAATSVPARLWCLEKGADGAWLPAMGPVDVTLGRNGLAWGRGEHSGEPPAGWRVKREGDGCSPAGVFKLPFAFGAGADGGGLRLPWRQMTDAMAGVDDAKSAHYNTVVDATAVTKDWDSAEVMNRPDGLYRLGAFVAHNPDRVPGAGSCIFLHEWTAPGDSTSGCTAMTAENLRAVLAWLDPAAEPRLVQWVAE